jgi:hypothetical protein
MSIKERLQRVSTEQELHEVVQDLWAFGSSNWTFDTAARFVASDLWRHLDRYFDSGGRLHSRLPAAPAAANDRGLDAQESNGISAATAVEQGDFPTAPSARRGYGSVSDLICSFHSQLDAIRIAHLPALSQDLDRAGSAVTTFVERAVVEESGVEPVETVLEGDELFFCQICDRSESGIPALYRGRPMCEDCATLLRERG